MPTLAQMEAATPKCPVMIGSTNVHAGVRCAKSCRYDAAGNLWRCPEHDEVLAGEVLGQINNSDALVPI